MNFNFSFELIAGQIFLGLVNGAFLALLSLGLRERRERDVDPREGVGVAAARGDALHRLRDRRGRSTAGCVRVRCVVRSAAGH